MPATDRGCAPLLHWLLTLDPATAGALAESAAVGDEWSGARSSVAELGLITPATGA